MYTTKNDEPAPQLLDGQGDNLELAMDAIREAPPTRAHASWDEVLDQVGPSEGVVASEADWRCEVLAFGAQASVG